MNPIMHCRISQKNWGGQENDYYAIHDFIDSTKVLCSDNRHRILHTIWGIKNVIIPIFGHTLINSDGKQVDIKDMCERDHLLVDYHYQFIPTLNDFIIALDETNIIGLEQKIEQFHRNYVINFNISPSLFFNNMKFEHWMDNGVSYPPSAKQIEKLKLPRKLTHESSNLCH